MKELKQPNTFHFPLRLKEVKKGKNFWGRLKYRYFVSPFVYEFTEDYTIQIGKDHFITIEKGFETDLSSVPPFLWKLLPPITNGGDGTFAHDYIYIKDYKRKQMGDFKNKVWGDEVMFDLRKGHVSKFDNWTRYIGVLLFGWKIYNRKPKNEAENK